VGVEGGVHRADQRFSLDVALADLVRLFRFDQEELVVCSVLADPRALLALHQPLYGAIGQAQELQDGAERADLEDVVRRRLVGLRLLLRREEDRSEERRVGKECRARWWRWDMLEAVSW